MITQEKRPAHQRQPFNKYTPNNNKIDDFRQELIAKGFVIQTPIIADGQIQRVYIEGDGKGSKNGWYVLYDDPILAGAYGSWKTNQSYQWSCGHGEKLSPAQQKSINAKIQQARLEAQEKQDRLYKETQDKAQSLYKNALPSGHSHPYLLTKGVNSYGLTVYKSALVIPLIDQHYVVHSLQFIAPDGQKRFLKNGRKAGMFFPIGTLSQDTPKIGIAEGYATGASIYEATKMPCIVAFDIHNMVNVAKIISKTYPHAEIIICADNDTHSVNNIGLNKAKQIASLIGAKLAIAGGAS